MNKPAGLSFTCAGPAHLTKTVFGRMSCADVFGDAKIELVDGERRRMMSPTAGHAGRQASGIARLYALLGDAAGMMGEAGLVLRDDTVIACDVALLASPVTEHRWPLPDKVLLASGTSETSRQRDVGLERAEYATGGIPHDRATDDDRSVVHA